MRRDQEERRDRYTRVSRTFAGMLLLSQSDVLSCANAFLPTEDSDGTSVPL